MPFLPAGVGAAVATAAAGAAAAGAVSYGIGKLTAADQKGAIATGQQQANAAQQPYADPAAVIASGDLLGLHGPDAATVAMGNFQKSPGYDWSVSEGLRAVDAGASAKGYLRSGATLKAEQTLGNNLGNQEFGNYFNRLNTLAGFGNQAAAGIAGTDTSAAGANASIYGKAGENTSKAVGSGLNSLATAYTDYKTSKSAGSGGFADNTSTWGY